jgi:exodeoxyribonuclease-5
MNLSAQQERALDAVGSWFHSKSSPLFRVFGYAGTGKSTIAKHFAEMINGQTRFAAFTGKAAHVLRTKGCPNTGTIHSLIYNPRDKSRRQLNKLLVEKIELEKLDDVDQELDELQRAIDEERQRVKQPAFDLNQDSGLSSADLLVVDECSMVGESIAQDLLSFGVPILVLGDPAQLPPVMGRGYFTEAKPDVMLTEIHRQARDNPIIDLATRVRENKPLPVGQYGTSQVVRVADFDKSQVTASSQILVGRNKTRNKANTARRKALGMDGSPAPIPGDRLVCLRNNKENGLMNGSIWTVVEILARNDATLPDTEEYCLRGEDDGRELDVCVHLKPFYGEELQGWDKQDADEFCFGYAMTVHKAQGSQFDDVFLMDESYCFRGDAQRWLYTGITRAAERITVIK